MEKLNFIVGWKNVGQTEIYLRFPSTKLRENLHETQWTFAFYTFCSHNKARSIPSSANASFINNEREPRPLFPAITLNVNKSIKRGKRKTPALLSLKHCEIISSFVFSFCISLKFLPQLTSKLERQTNCQKLWSAISWNFFPDVLFAFTFNAIQNFLQLQQFTQAPFCRFNQFPRTRKLRGRSQISIHLIGEGMRRDNSSAALSFTLYSKVPNAHKFSLTIKQNQYVHN